MQTRWYHPIACLAVGSFAVMLLAACAPGGQSEGRTVSSSRTVLTVEELEASAATNLLDAVRRLRPTWLRSRSGGGTAAVFIDGIHAGDLSRLETIYLQVVREVRYISAADATMRWGTGYPNGAIDVITRR